jgi:hypothetical protein
MTRTTLILALEAVAITGALTLALDLREHGRVAPLGGVNEWGYRGPVAHHRQPQEIRVAIVGGTRAFGWGEPASALVTELKRVIMLRTDHPGAELRPVTVVNLGRLGALPGDYPEIIEHFGYLQPDYICLFDDLGVSGGSPTWGTDGTSGVYALTGYAPALPLVLREKGLAWRFGDVERGYASADRRGDAEAPLLRRIAGTTVDVAGRSLAAIDRRLAGVTASHRGRAERLDGAAYADAMATAIQAAHQRARGVVVVTSPGDTAVQIDNLHVLEARLTANGPESWLRLVKLGDDPGLSDPALRIDGWSFSSAGIARLATRIAPALLSLIPS